jgi:HPt (histidine-containing phosphotransfer) domain-containing protein
MTANVMQGDRDRCLAAGMDDYLSKPVTAETLRMLVQRWLPEFTAHTASGEFPRPPGLPPAAPQPSPIDTDAFAALKALAGDDDPTFLPTLIEQFLQDATSYLDSMSQAAERDEATALERAAHTLKSTSANLGALGMAGLCQQLQALGRTGTTTGAAALLDQLSDEFCRVRQCLTHECALWREATIPQ